MANPKNHMSHVMEEAHERDSEALPKPKKENTNVTLNDIWVHKRVLGWCFIIFMLPVNFGYEVTMIGKMLAVDSFLHRFGQQVGTTWVVAATDQQILNSASAIGIVASAGLTGYLSDAFGRRSVIALASLICIAGILVQYFSTTILQVFGGKLISCFGFGLGHSLGPVFVAELAPTKLRGICLTLINTMIVLGQWLASVAAFGASDQFTDDRQWRIPIITQVIPPIILSAGVLFLPESPSWLFIKGRTEDAKRAFKKFNSPDFDADKAVDIMNDAIAKEKELNQANKTSTWVGCFKGPNGRRTLIICMVYLSQQFIGVSFIASYLTYYFKLAGVDNALGMAQMAYAIQLLGNMASWPLVERLGRRPMIVVGMSIMTAALLLIGGISTIGTPAALKATVSFMAVWGFLYQATIGAVAYAVGGETPSPFYRQKTYSIGIMLSTAVQGMYGQVVPYLINTDKANLGGKICFVYFATSLPMCIYLYFCLPEMKSRNFAELEEMFQAKLPARKFKNYICQSQLEDEPRKGSIGTVHELTENK